MGRVALGDHEALSAPVEVSAAGRHRHDGVRAHRTRTLAHRDVTRHYGIPVTTPARTLLDLADVLDDAALARAVNDARLEAQLKLDHLAAQLTRSPGRRATRRLRPFVENADAPTRSTFEDAFLAFTERYGIPRPEVNQQVDGYEVDMLWREQHLVVELDSRTYHDTPGAFEDDRRRDADLLAAGFPVMRLTWRRFLSRPAGEAARLQALLTR
ncbi:MAG: hypothetical protein JWN32_4274 [Solirubrobacterales bacterium]|nr:hypothetical protein [Solirubrobacterales bacterium]